MDDSGHLKRGSQVSSQSHMSLFQAYGYAERYGIPPSSIAPPLTMMRLRTGLAGKTKTLAALRGILRSPQETYCYTRPTLEAGRIRGVSLLERLDSRLAHLWCLQETYASSECQRSATQALSKVRVWGGVGEGEPQEADELHRGFVLDRGSAFREWP